MFVLFDSDRTKGYGMHKFFSTPRGWLVVSHTL